MTSKGISGIAYFSITCRGREKPKRWRKKLDSALDESLSSLLHRNYSILKFLVLLIRIKIINNMTVRVIHWYIYSFLDLIHYHIVS